MGEAFLRRAISYINSGQIKEGQALLLKVVEQNPANDRAWLWLAATVEDINKRRYYLWMASQANPNNALARMALEDKVDDRAWLQQRLQAESEQPEFDPSPALAAAQKFSWRAALPQLLVPVVTYPLTLLILVGVVVLAFSSNSQVSAKIATGSELAENAIVAPISDDLAPAATATASKPAPTATRPAPTATRPTSTAVVLATSIKASPTASPTALPSKTPTPTATPAPTFDPNNWMSLPVIPPLSNTALEIYRKGQELGNNPKSFSKVGDCNTLSVRFLTYFDLAPSAYNLENYSELAPVLDQFKGSFYRQSIAVGDGFNTSAVLSPFRADPKYCKVNESPLVCEYRLHKPSFAFIAIGTDDYLTQAKFEVNLRQIVRTTIGMGIVPILATKADNANQLNYNPVIVKVAHDFDIPLWNLGAAFEPLPQGGLQDNMHPSGEFAAFDLSADNLARWGWTVRNLTALEILNTVWSSVNK
jgi:hypothetical protein